MRSCRPVFLHTIWCRKPWGTSRTDNLVRTGNSPRAYHPIPRWTQEAPMTTPSWKGYKELQTLFGARLWEDSTLLAKTLDRHISLCKKPACTSTAMVNWGNFFGRPPENMRGCQERIVWRRGWINNPVKWQPRLNSFIRQAYMERIRTGPVMPFCHH